MKNIRHTILTAGLLLAAFASPSLASPHRIAIRQGSGGGEFYDTITNQTFIPRGNNYVRLANQAGDDHTSTVFYHATFDPGRYDAGAVNTALVGMHNNGYNTVRVFLNHLTIGNSAGSGLSAAYLANVTDFLVKAKAQGIYTQLVAELLPRDGGYWAANQNPGQIGDDNWLYMSQEGVQSKKNYMHDLIVDLQALNAPLDYVIGYEIENEQYFLEDKPPLSFSSGTVTVPTGTFDMSSAFDRQNLMDSSLLRWISEVRSTIRSLDPTALVTAGFFAPREVEKTPDNDPRIDRTYWVIADPAIGGSAIDYVDLHSYPTGQSFDDDYNSFEITSNKKPLVMGEYGSHKSYFGDITAAAYGARDWQKAACTHGLDGYLFWTWDTTEQAGSWSLSDNGGAINGVLAPVVRPDPCQ